MGKEDEMQMPDPKSSAETLMKAYGNYHLAKLHSDGELSAYAKRFDEAQDQLVDRIEELKKKKAAALTALAVRNGEKTALGTVIRQFYNLLLMKCANDKKAELYKKYFHGGMLALVSGPIEAQIKNTGAIITLFEEEDDKEILAYREKISSALERLKTAAKVYKSADSEQKNLFSMVQVDKTEWLGIYRLNYLALAQLFYKEPKRAGTFFKAPPKPKKSGGGETTETQKR
jgi:hypothetical protein